MNTVLTYLAENWQRLQLGRYGPSERLSSVFATPRFRASSHIIVFILAEGYSDPILVVKMPRLAGDNARLDREAYNLNRVHFAWLDGRNSIPRVVAYEDWSGTRLLIETALQGQPMKPAFVRRNVDFCLETVVAWLINLHQKTLKNHNEALHWFEDLAVRPIDYLAALLPASSVELDSLREVGALSEPLRFSDFPLVFEHGDLSSPNILVGPNSGVGVVDWELAEPNGLPAGDLFFFLTYIAFARGRTPTTTAAYVKAFHQAFFGQDAWTRPYIFRYAHELQLSRELLKPLFLLYWCRYVANLARRLSNSDTDQPRLEVDTLRWLRSNRYYALCQHALRHSHELYFN